ncbi:hypothetical protein, partial [Acetivibrio ethanolgignens]|uniref:hypothetical protein n=1 Tax=Acetivibrio ethanolgignens TaxID=290052 RepID=UPI0011C87796
MIRKITKRVIATTLVLAIAITPLTNLKINNHPTKAQAASASDMTGAKLWSGKKLLKEMESKKSGIDDYDKLEKQIEKLNKDYKGDKTKGKDGKKLKGAYYLTWTTKNKQASPKVEHRWRTVGHYITPKPVKYSSDTPTYLYRKVYYKPNYRIKDSDGIRVDSTKKFQYTERTEGDMVITRYVLSYNYVTKEIVKWNNTHKNNKFKPLKDKDKNKDGWEMYVQPIIEAYNATTGKIYKSNILSVEDWVNALGGNPTWDNSTTFHTNYNNYYEWHAKPIEPQYVQVHYIEENNPDNKLYEDPARVKYENGGKTYQTAGGLYGDEGKQLYKSEIENEGEHYVITGFYATYGKKESKKVQSQLSATKVVEAYETQN